jgi:hypothetical protein
MHVLQRRGGAGITQCSNVVAKRLGEELQLSDIDGCLSAALGCAIANSACAADPPHNKCPDSVTPARHRTDSSRSQVAEVCGSA